MPTDWADKVGDAITHLKTKTDRVLDPDQALAIIDDVVQGNFAAADLATIHGIPQAWIRSTLGHITRAVGSGRVRSLATGAWYELKCDDRVIAPGYVKAYVRRNKNDAADAAAICEAVGRPSMRFVAPKTEQQQAASGIHRVRALLIKQRTAAMNTLRGLLAEFGIIANKGMSGINELLTIVADPDDTRIAGPLRAGLVAIAATLRALDTQLEKVDQAMLSWGRADKTCRHLNTIPGFGPILSTAMAARVTSPQGFDSGRHFAASLGIVPRQDGTGGKVKLGPISKRGDGYLRRLLVNGAMSVLRSKRTGC
jgi:transposase